MEIEQSDTLYPKKTHPEIPGCGSALPVVRCQLLEAPPAAS